MVNPIFYLSSFFSYQLYHSAFSENKRKNMYFHYVYQTFRRNLRHFIIFIKKIKPLGHKIVFLYVFRVCIFSFNIHYATYALFFYFNLLFTNHGSRCTTSHLWYYRLSPHCCPLTSAYRIAAIGRNTQRNPVFSHKIPLSSAR